MMITRLSILLLSLGIGLQAGNANFEHNVTTEKKPWTHENFLNDSQEFSFAIIPDRAGGERKGIFPKAIERANLLRPEFIICVGDLIQGMMNKNYQTHDHLREQWKELRQFTESSEAPFFYLVGNHDIARTRPNFPRANETSREVWKENFGAQTYYSFIYKNVLFLCLNHMEGRDGRTPQTGMTTEQVNWATDTIQKHPEVNWTFIFIHAPGAWTTSGFGKIEKALADRDYTVFSGDWHYYVKFQRRGKNYYTLATAGGVSELKGVPYGEFDHITWVTMTRKGPVIANILIDGILPDDVVTSQTTKQKLKNQLDIPHKDETAVSTEK